ncbi:MAG: DUF4097 family beta strand repeat-containing protein [Oscillospiraceae bacterium]|nr:DUF4097 family beta strand repeat-containing protein [Oscillospiraceae bacterium]
MNSAQKVIKYVALAFGVFLAVGIISAIINVALGVLSFSGILTKSIKTTSFSQSYADVTELDIYSFAGEIRIVSADDFKVEASNVPVNFSCTLKDGKLVVNNKNKSVFSFFGLGDSLHPVITVYVPDNEKLSRLTIENGAGKLSAESIYCDDFRLEAGAGAFYVDSLIADNAELNTGVGEVSIKSAILGGLDLQAGVGRFYMKGELNGDADIDGGVGSLTLKLLNSRDDHSFDINTGVGSITIDGERFSTGKINVNNSKGKIKIDGGVGKISINYEK